MLELDLVLKIFLDKHYDQLSAPESETFKEMLNYPDNELWDFIIAKTEPTDKNWNSVLTLLRSG